MSRTPIADHALLSDRHSAALVTRDGSIDWLSFPRFDSPSVLGRLLDDGAGHWSVRPVGVPDRVSRRYVDATMVLETTWELPDGAALVVRDAMLTGPRGSVHDLGAGAPHCLVRRLTCTSGEVEVDVEVALRPEYGLVHPLLTPVEGGVRSRGGADTFVLTVPFDVDVAGSTVRGRTRLAAGESVHLALHRSTPGAGPARVWPRQELADALEDTVAAWRGWSAAHQGYTGPWADLVHRSGRVLYALSFQPTGAVVAAATTSLPEGVGGGRTWDYRYTWVRDASFAMEALWVAACPDEAADFFSFMTTAAASSVVSRRLPLQIMFGVGGERDLTERTLPHLTGWRDSRPVRVGNGAWQQEQVDVYGELLGAAWRLSDQLGDLDEATRGFLASLADAAAVRWREPDQGIWEIRGEPRHFVYSKVMCWVALDRAVRLADRLGADARVGEWARVRDEIHAAVLREGWNEQAGAFTQSFGSAELDASTLMLPLVGFLPPDDPRVLATLDATLAGLTDDRGLVYRYRGGAGVDGLDGEEGTFLLCTFWLAQAAAVAGRVGLAREVFERAVRYANDLGLLAEEVDPATGELLGNFPQAFSHIGLVNAAYAIQLAERAQGPEHGSPDDVTEET